MRPETGSTEATIKKLAQELVTKLVEDHAMHEWDKVEHVFAIEMDDVPLQVHIRVVLHEPTGTVLSPREGEIADMVAQGHTNQAIADFLGISTWTVSTHLRRVFAKLGVNSRAAMVAGVLTNGWRPRPEPARSRPATATALSSRPRVISVSVTENVP